MKSNFRALFADNIHFHERGMPLLLRRTAQYRGSVEFHRQYEALKHACGRYDDFPEVYGRAERFKGISKQKLRDLHHTVDGRRIKFFDACVYELMAYLFANEPSVGKLPMKAAYSEVFEWVYEYRRDDLLLNYAAVEFWADHFNDFLFNNDKNEYSHVFVFSGCAIYSYIITNLLIQSATRVFVVEHTFAGDYHYLEERYSPIASQCDYRHIQVRDQYIDELSEKDWIKSRKDVHAIMTRPNNKNVKQPPSTYNQALFGRGRTIVAILGQVANDYSLLTQSSVILNSVEIYKTIIRRILLDTNYCVVFKGHPWENHKQHMKGPHTISILKEFVSRFPLEDARRVSFKEDYNLIDLANTANYLITINSQSAIEIAYHTAKKSFCIGKPFYNGIGCTVSCETIEELLDQIVQGVNGPKFGYREYAYFVKALEAFFLSYAIGRNDGEGVRKIDERLYAKRYGAVRELGERVQREGEGWRTKGRFEKLAKRCWKKIPLSIYNRFAKRP